MERRLSDYRAPRTWAHAHDKRLTLASVSRCFCVCIWPTWMERGIDILARQRSCPVRNILLLFSISDTSTQLKLADESSFSTILGIWACKMYFISLTRNLFSIKEHKVEEAHRMQPVYPAVLHFRAQCLFKEQEIPGGESRENRHINYTICTHMHIYNVTRVTWSDHFVDSDTDTS